MSIISRIFKSYRIALTESQTRYERAYTVNAQNALDFYNSFLNRLLISYGTKLQQPFYLNQLAQRFEQFFQKREIPFVAIDGTCSKDPFQDFMVFFAAAYGVKGNVAIEPQPPRLRYQRWSMDQDVSLVAYVPIPYAEAGDITDEGYREEFVVDDTAKINLSSIHTRLMQLAEVYLAYEMASGSALEYPRLILMDMSLSSVLMSTDVGIEKIRLFGCPIGSRELRKEDGLVVYAHPLHNSLDIPTAKQYRRWAYLVRRLSETGVKTLTINQIEADTGVSAGEWDKTFQEPHAQRLLERSGDEVRARFDLSASWFDSVRLFEEFCDRLFHRRDPNALVYRAREDGTERERWMCPEDVAFLTAIGLRALIEKCWERGILLLSIAKDSSTQYFSRQFLGVMREIGIFPAVPVGSLPWTDRVLLETIAYQADDLQAPWSTVEFDSVFMTLHVAENEKGQRFLRGMRGDIINPERLFARSLAQFFYQRTKATPLMGHVIFIDRLLVPDLDQGAMNGPEISNSQLGTIVPAYFGEKDTDNPAQALSAWLLKILTRNLFPEVIGYPDPLHKADWGAKTVKRRVDRVIASSETAFRARPLSRLFRTQRDAAGR